MKIYHSLTEIPSLVKPISLTIGMFDGVHKGHQHLLNYVKKNHGSCVVLTFINHPAEFLHPGKIQPSLTTAEEKAHLLSKHSIEHVIMLPFTSDIAQMSYKLFLREIHKCLPFNNLFIGENDAFGKNREGTKEALIEFSPSLDFIPHYIPKLKEKDEIISSSRIRNCLKNGNLLEAENLLNRPLTFSSIDNGLLKPGKYKVRILAEGKDTFSEKTITIDETGGYKLEKPSIITFLTQKG